MQVSGINVDELEAFIAVAQAGSFRQAAERLSTSQPTITNRIQKLEERLGLKLFSRTTRRVALTEAGSRIVPRAERAMLDLARMVADAREEADLKRGRVVVGASPTVAAALLVPLLREFMTKYPDVEVRLSDDFRAPLLERLNNGRLDLAILPLAERTTDFTCEMLFVEDLRFVAPRSFSLAINRSYRFAEICHHPFVTMPDPSAIRSTLAEAFALQGKTFRPVIEANSLITLLGLVESGVGLSLLPDTLIPERLLANMDLLHVTDMERKRQISLVTARNRALPAAAAAFAKMVRVRLRRSRTRKAQAVDMV